MTESAPAGAQPAIPFKAETRQLLNILIHSLYTDREIFLRELISNASDALTRMNFVMLTEREVVDPEAPLEIRIQVDPENRTLTITDTGVGMNRDELVENLGTIAHSGARAFIDAAEANAAQGKPTAVQEIIGQFGVGFYSAFMVAESIRVTSRSYRPGDEAAEWYATGEDTYTLAAADKTTRGTRVEIKLKEDAAEFAQEHRLRDIIRRHSDFVAYPIYLNDGAEQVNRQTAIWRQNPRQTKQDEVHEFYKQLTLDPEPPQAYAHMSVDAPVQMYALLFVPASAERGMFALRREPGLKLYARKVLIQEYNKDLLPEYFNFVQGVVDSEDLPLNVSRETVQSNRVMGQLKKLVTAKVIDTLKSVAKDRPEDYVKFWEAYGRFIKEGVALEPANHEALFPLLRFHTTTHPGEWSSLDDYVSRMKPGQERIYYIVGDDERALLHSPHLDPFRKQQVEVILLADPVDSFMILRLPQYQDHLLENAGSAKAELPKTEAAAAEEQAPALPEDQMNALIGRFKAVLDERVSDVRATDRLTGSPARLVDPEGALDGSMQRVYRLLEKDYEAPVKVLEVNPRHPLMARLSALPEGDELSPLVIEQLYEDALLVEGLHPNPAAMIERIQKIMEKSLG